MTRRLAWSATLALAAMASACNSPLWRYDRYTIDGAFTGKACNITLDGQPLAPDTTDSRAPVQVMRDASTDAPRGEGVHVLRCRGLIVLIVSPEAKLPPPGRYRIVDASFISIEPGTAVMGLMDSGVGTGLWPFAVFGAHLAATEGVFQLGAITDSTIHGTFRAIARRQLSGE